MAGSVWFVLLMELIITYVFEQINTNVINMRKYF